QLPYAPSLCSMYHSRNVVKRQERTLAVVVRANDARACPHGLRRAGDLRRRTLAGPHAMGRRRHSEAALWHTPRVGTRASHSASQASFPWTTRPPGVTIAGRSYWIPGSYAPTWSEKLLQHGPRSCSNMVREAHLRI